MCVCARAHVPVSMSVYVSMRACMRVCACVVCVCVCVCVRARVPKLKQLLKTKQQKNVFLFKYLQPFSGVFARTSTNKDTAFDMYRLLAARMAKLKDYKRYLPSCGRIHEVGTHLRHLRGEKATVIDRI